MTWPSRRQPTKRARRWRATAAAAVALATFGTGMFSVTSADGSNDGPDDVASSEPVDASAPEGAKWVAFEDLDAPELAEYAPISGPDDPAAATVADCVYWVSLDGDDDDGDGSGSSPWRTIRHAVRTVPDEGCTILVAPGTYDDYHNLKRRVTKTLSIRSAVPHAAVLTHDGTVLDIDGGRNLLLEGFRLYQRGAGPEGKVSYLAIVDRAGDTWSERITLRNNIFHDSLNDDLLKIHNGVDGMNVVGNVFYNQGPSEQHIDVNSVRNVRITGNIFFNDFAASDRTLEDQKAFIVVKDSGGDTDGLLGSRDITIDRNVFASWQGGSKEPWLQIGNDGKPYFEAIGVRIESNLFIGNSAMPSRGLLGVRGVKDVTFNGNTVVGDLPASGYGLYANITGENLLNETMRVTNNVFADPTATMGRFSSGVRDTLVNLFLDRNLYFNAGVDIEDGPLAGPSLDARAVIDDPLLPPIDGDLVFPFWTGTSFANGELSIRAEFRRLVVRYGLPGIGSPVVDRADVATAPTTDILGRPRGGAPDLGAVELPDLVDELPSQPTGSAPAPDEPTEETAGDDPSAGNDPANDEEDR